MPFGEFNDSYKKQTLNGYGALSELKEFYDKYPLAKTYAEKMQLIDFLIHTFHGNLNERPSRPTATNVIEGSNTAVANLIFNLAYGESSTVAADELDKWLEKYHRSIHRYIDPTTGKLKKETSLTVARDSKKVYYNFLPAIEPRISISSGDKLIVETFDAAGGMFLDGWAYERPNPVTGPIFVSGASPGDTLEVEINCINLVGTGYMHIPNTKDGVLTKFTRNGHEFVKAEATAGGMLRVLNNNGKKFPASPMIGVIGVAVSPGSVGEYPSTGAGDHGGNMDNSIIKAGTKVYLPVFTEGALLGIGDVHGVMGDGEIFDQGMEMCADIDMTVKVRKDMKINRPFIISNDIISTTATAATIEEASALAVSDMRYILETYYSLSHVDAGLMIGFYGNLRVCQLINKTMRLEISKEILSEFTK